MFNPNNKLGIKELSEEQLIAGLPNYKALKSRISQIRKVASLVDRSVLADETFEAMKYDQIISILGGRGAGKTSVLYTIYKHLKNSFFDGVHCGDIVLPIIMPELIEKNEGILSWLLAAMEDNLCDIEKELRIIKRNNNDPNEESDVDDFFYDRCRCNNEKDLRNAFDELKNAYYTQNYKFNTDSYSETREWKAKSVDSSYNLMKRFVIYWNILVDKKILINNYYTGVKNEDYTPLICIFIDDADLSPQIINELIYALQKYLAHPNVVVFISASQKTLKYAVKNHMYKLITQSSFDLPALMEVEYYYNGERKTDFEEDNTVRFQDLRYGREYDKINKLSDEILRKLFPVYNRFYLKKYEKYDEKKYLRVYKTDNNFSTETIDLHKYVEEILSKFAVKVLKLHCNNKCVIAYEDGDEPSRITIDEKIKNTSILNIDKRIPEILQSKKDEEILDLLNYCSFKNDFYLSFFGIYPRDIVGILFSLSEMLEELYQILESIYYEPKENKSNLNKEGISFDYVITIRDALIKFLDSCTSSNRNLQIFSRMSRDFIQTQRLHWQLFIDYSKVVEIFSDSKYVSDNRENPTPFIEMFCLLNFIEQIIVLLIPQRRSSHGSKWFSILMNESSIKVIKQNDDLNDMFDQYYLFHSLNIIPVFKEDRIEHQFSFMHGASMLGLFDSIQQKKERMQFAEWYGNVVKVYFNRYNKISRLNRYKNELISIMKYSCLSKDCASICEDYKREVSKIFDKKTDNGIIKRDYPYEAIEVLDKAVSQERIYIRNKDELDRILNRLDGGFHSLIMKDIVDIVNTLKRKRTINISELLSMKSMINNVINNSIRFRDGEYEKTLADINIYLKSNVSISDSANTQIVKSLNKITDEILAFLRYFNASINGEIDSENKVMKNMPNYEDIEKYFKNELEILETETWSEFWGDQL